MKLTTYITLSSLLILAACGGKKDNLSNKRAELEKLKSEIATLQSKAKKLEDEIAVLDPKIDEGKLVESETIQPGIFNSYLSINGKADADQSTIATAQVPATVKSVVARIGQQVSAGQALAYLDASVLRESRNQVEQQVSFATTLFNKQKRLWDQGVGTEIQYISAKNQKEAAEKSLASMDAQIGMYTIKSPISGTIESIDVKVGQTAAPGMPLFKVVNLRNLKVVAEVAESYSSKLNQGDKVLISFPDLNKKVEAKITFASKVIDQLNRTFHIEINLPTMSDVKPNMIANLQIVDYSNSKALSVPTNCIQSAEEDKYVVVVRKEGDKTVAHRKIVKTGHSGELRTEIISGIDAGDQIIVNGYQELIDGQIITVTANSEGKNK